jgi:glycine betaine/proline transport system substrate-binding protein
VRLIAVAAIVLALAVAAGCGGAGDSSDDSGDSVAARAETGTLRVGEFTWSAARLTNAILEEIVAQHPELGIERVERVEVSPDEGWFQLETGRLDVLTEVYLPNQQGFATKAKDETELLHRVYEGAVNAWFVPRYAIEPGGAAAGLKRIDQLDRYADAFGRTLYDGEPGWVTTEQNADRIEGFGLDLEHETGSEAELVAELKRHYRRRRPILLYLWRPHWVHSAFDLVELEEPNPYSADCFGEGGKIACAMPTNDVWVAARNDLMERAPRLWKMLGSFEIPIADLEGMLFSVDGKGVPPGEAARGWVARNSATIDDWLEG